MNSDKRETWTDLRLKKAKRDGVIEGLNLALNILAELKSGCDINCMSEIENLIFQHQKKK